MKLEEGHAMEYGGGEKKWPEMRQSLSFRYHVEEQQEKGVAECQKEKFNVSNDKTFSPGNSILYEKVEHKLRSKMF